MPLVWGIRVLIYCYCANIVCLVLSNEIWSQSSHTAHVSVVVRLNKSSDGRGACVSLR